MTDCKKCSKAIFDQNWGEYKCSEKHHVIYPHEFEENCAFYHKGIPSVSKDDNEVFQGV